MNDDGASGLHAVIHPDGSAVLTVDETPQRIDTTAAEDARREIVERAASIAQQVGGPVPLVVEEPDGVFPLLVHPDGEVEITEQRQTSDAVDDRTAPTAEVALPAATDAASEDDRAVSGDEPTVLEDDPTPFDDDLTPFDDEPAVLDDDPTPGVDGDVEAPDEDEDEDEGVDDAPAPIAAPVFAGLSTPEPAPAFATDDADDRADEGAPEPLTTTDETLAEDAEVDPEAEDADAEPAPEPELSDPEPVATPRHARHGARPSFLTAERAEEPATQGWRRSLVALGLPVPPGPAERRERADVAAVSRLWTEPRTIAVVNGKGGSGKTPTSILLAAVFAKHGGAGVLAWDNNQTRGTLGWRTEKAEHDATLHDLLPETGRLLSSEAQAADLARFVHHQSRDRFDVLRSQPIALAEEQRMDSGDVSRIHAVAAKYYRLIIMDSGNDESDPMWLRMIDHTDQLVVATSTRGEHAEAGALLLEALAKRDERTAALAHGAVTIVSQADPGASGDELRRVVDGFTGLARDVATIPYDPAMIGGQLRFDNLRPATQRAWLAAGATVARGLDPA
ncbi:MinD/ParA family ATP-binding protein [Microbacterium sp. GXF7504]